MARRSTKVTHDHAHAGIGEDDVDACDLDFKKGEQTLDEDLPEAAGGVEVRMMGGGPAEDEVDACDVDFTAGDQTPDEELPAAAGGVAQ